MRNFIDTIDKTKRYRSTLSIVLFRGDSGGAAVTLSDPRSDNPRYLIPGGGGREKRKVQ